MGILNKWFGKGENGAPAPQEEFSLPEQVNVQRNISGYLYRLKTQGVDVAALEAEFQNIRSGSRADYYALLYKVEDAFLQDANPRVIEILRADEPDAAVGYDTQLVEADTLEKRQALYDVLMKVFIDRQSGEVKGVLDHYKLMSSSVRNFSQFIHGVVEEVIFRKKNELMNSTQARQALLLGFLRLKHMFDQAGIEDGILKHNAIPDVLLPLYASEKDAVVQQLRTEGIAVDLREYEDD